MKQKSIFDSFNQTAKSTRKAGDPHLELWKTWNESKQPEHLEPLMDAMEPAIQQYAKRTHAGLGGRIPYAAVEAKYRSSAKQSLDNFSPQGGTKVRNWVIGGFRRTRQFTDDYRNFSSVPRERLAHYQSFQNAKNEFLAQHGHEPTFEDMKVLLPEIPANKLKPMMSEFRRELFIGKSDDPDRDDDSSLGHSPGQIQSILSLAPAILSPDENRVLKELTSRDALAGKKPVVIAEIAKKTGLTENQVYRHRASIFKKVEPYIKKV